MLVLDGGVWWCLVSREHWCRMIFNRDGQCLCFNGVCWFVFMLLNCNNGVLDTLV